MTASNAAKPIQINLLLVRHGATSGNAEKRYIGKTDEPLSEAGSEKLRDFRAAGRYSDVSASPQFVFTSPMKRCVETAQILFPDVKPVAIENFRETDFGLFEGKNYDELMADDELRTEYQKWIDSGGKAAFPSGESSEAFIERTLQGFWSMMDLILKNCSECCCADLRGESVDVVAVIHGGSIMAILSSLCGGSFYDYQVENGGGYVCTARIEPSVSECTPSLVNLRRV